MALTDLDRIDPARAGSDVAGARVGSATSALLIIAICVSFAVIASAAASVVLLTGSAWFGSAVETLFVGFLFGAVGF
jgi:hypothetical protein